MNNSDQNNQFITLIIITTIFSLVVISSLFYYSSSFGSLLARSDYSNIEPVYVTMLPGSYDPENNGFYYPKELKLILGFNSTVIWINDDPDILHTVTASFSRNYFGESATRMNYLLPNEEWAFKFIDEGSYKYFCAPHPWMTGNIIVL